MTEERTLDEEWDAFVTELEGDARSLLYGDADDGQPRQAQIHAFADSLLRRIGDAEREMALIGETADIERARIDEWEAVERRKYERRLEYAAAELRTLVEAEHDGLTPEPGKKTRSLPHGDVGLRKRPASVEIDDPEKALAWCKSHNVKIHVKEEPRKTPLKKYAEGHGNKLPAASGARYVPGRDHFYYSVRSEADS